MNLFDFIEIHGESLSIILQIHPRSVYKIKTHKIVSSFAILHFEPRSVSEWWPEPELFPDGGARKHIGLFVRGQRKPRTRKAKGKAQRKDAAKPSSSTKKVKKKGKSKGQNKAKNKAKTKKIKLQESKSQEPIENVEANFKRTGVGPVLVCQEMERAKHVDKLKFPGNLLFSEKEDTCRMTVGGCANRPWADFLEAAPGYFRCKFLR